MPTYLYCLLPATSEGPPADLAGIAGERIRRLAARDVAAWVGTIADRAVSRALETARQHDAVVRAALRSGVTPLPARGGQWFDDDERCVAEISERAPAIAAALERVAGCVEMSVHVTMPAREAAADAAQITEHSGVPAPGARRAGQSQGGGRGREYLEALRATRDMEHKVQAELATAGDVVSNGVSTLVRAQSIGRADAGGELTLYHLVPRENVSRYREIAEALASRQPVRVRLGGPYAPYSFSEIGG